MTLKMKNNIFNSELIVSDELDAKLKKCFIKHLVIYNYSIELMYKYPSITFKQLKSLIQKYIIDNEIVDYIGNPLYNEIYYQFKKFNKNIKSQKLVSDIHYFTFLVNGYNNKSFTIEKVNNITILTIKDFDGYITLNKELPKEYENSLLYFNISYSSFENKYLLSVFE